ncbi:MAG TPA: STAS domain-containing protein [Oligoflexia bacterium]|nr:STAS domain-containing protein [Oligoflexia bacterium]HMP49229.1 STAS domain-containing protein [Oligoflexia bacterium]
MERLDFKVTNVGDVAIIELSTDLDNENAGDALRNAFNSLVERGQKNIVLDFDKVEIINSYGLGKVLLCQKKLQLENGVLMVKPLKGFVREVFEMLMLDPLFPKYTPESSEQV